MTRIITFTGAQGTGKTTMRKALVKYLRNKGHYVVDQYHGIKDSIARDAKNFGFIINEKTNFEAQYYMASRFSAADLETRAMSQMNNVDFIVLDRCVLDVIPYTLVSDDIMQGDKEIIVNMLYTHYEKFPTELIYCEPLDFITSDKDRSTSVQFQKDIENEFIEVIHEIDKSLKATTILESDTVQSRLNKIRGILDL